MKIERTKNTIRNIIFGSLNKIIGIILPFASRTAILYILGEQYLGLSSLFTSILSFLSLAELGLGAAMVYSMYKPIAKNDDQTVKALLNLYRRFFRIIGVVIFGIGLIIMIFLPKIIKDDIPADINIYALYLIYLLNASLSYWLFAYKNALIQAYQRNDIESKISMIVTPLSYVFMLAFLFIFHDYYAYIIWVPIFTIVTNVIRLIKVNKMYPNLKPEGTVSKELKASIFKKVKALIGTKLNSVVLHAADNIVMAAFFGLTTIAIYGNYYYIMTSISGFLGICYSAMTAGLGNSLVTETNEKNYRDFSKFSFINAWLVGWCTICLVCLYQPFMRIWVGEELLFPFYIMIQFAVYFYVTMIRKIPVTYKDAAGIWWEDRFRPYVCMVTNLVLNITLVQIIGISGIILSSVISLLISIPWENYTIFKYIFNMSPLGYYKKMAYYLISTVIAGLATFYICNLFKDNIAMLFVRGIICVIIPNIIFVLLNVKSQEFKDTKMFVKSIVKRR